MNASTAVTLFFLECSEMQIICEHFILWTVTKSVGSALSLISGEGPRGGGQWHPKMKKLSQTSRLQNKQFSIRWGQTPVNQSGWSRETRKPCAWWRYDVGLSYKGHYFVHMLAAWNQSSPNVCNVTKTWSLFWNVIQTGVKPPWRALVSHDSPLIQSGKQPLELSK